MPKTSKVLTRPDSLSSFRGQERVKKLLSVSIKAAKIRRDSHPHTLLKGPSGYGKTTLARIISNEMKVRVIEINAPSISNSIELIQRMTTMKTNSIVFVDEIHRLNAACQETLYPAMEDFTAERVLSFSKRSVKVELPRFTLIGATTEPGSLTLPLQNRFTLKVELEEYGESELEEIVFWHSKQFKMELSTESVRLVGVVSRGTPRQIVSLLSCIRDYAQISNTSKVEVEFVKGVLRDLGIAENGLTLEDHKYLRVLVGRFAGGPTGIETLSLSSGLDQYTIKSIIEPFLLKLGVIERTPRGRVARVSSIVTCK